MSFNHWLQNLRSALAPRRGQRHHARRGSLRAATHRLNLEVLEDRRLLAFLAPVDYAVGLGPRETVSADFNNDTTLDLAIANRNDNTVSVLLGNADGTFQPAVSHATGAYPVSLAVGDLDGDGKIDDLATANYNSNDVSVLLGNDDGTFQPASSVGIGSRPWSIAVGDFDGDGLFDLGVTSSDRFDDYYYGYDRGTAHVLMGTGGGDFSGPNSTDLGYGAHDYALAADLNGDPYDDFVTFASFNTDGYITVLLGDSSGYLQGPTGSFHTGDYTHDVAAGDLDGDGDNDLVIANFYGKSVGVLLGDGSGGFSGPVNYATGESPLFSIVLGDFTHDGNLDVATTNHGSNQVSVLYGDGAGALSKPAVSGTGSGPLAVAGDFNGDGWLDAATVSYGTATVSVLINDQSWSSPPPPAISVSDVTVTEGNTGTVSATFTLTLLYASNVDVTVHYATADITAAGSDYTAASGDVIIPAGQTSRTFTVAVKGDRLAEPTETFAVNLSAATNATIGDGQAIGTILDNEPRISISDVTKAEGKKGKTTSFTFTVTLSAAYDQAVSMSYQTVNGTATTGDGDYIAKTGTLTFAPGETTKTITIEVKGDSKRESNETFYLDLFGLSSNALFTKNRGLGTILNDD